MIQRTQLIDQALERFGVAELGIGPRANFGGDQLLAVPAYFEPQHVGRSFDERLRHDSLGGELRQPIFGQLFEAGYCSRGGAFDQFLR